MKPTEIAENNRRARAGRVSYPPSSTGRLNDEPSPTAAPILSDGPSGLGGEFQREYFKDDMENISLIGLVLFVALLMGGK